jgi:monoamine oxidase
MIHPIVIIGAGLSGLYAASLLEKKGYSPIIIEGRNRIGGRVYGDAPSNFAHQFELGPSWFWPALNPRMSHLVQTYHLKHFPQFSSGGTLTENANNQIQRWDSAYGDESYHRIEGGMTQVVHAVRNGLTQSQIRLGEEVKSLRLTEDDSVAISIEKEGQSETLFAKKVISAIPLRILGERIDWEPALGSEVQTALEHIPTWMAGQAKFVAAYPTAFWRKNGLSGNAMSQRGPLTEIHDASNTDASAAALFGFIGVRPEARQKIGPEHLQSLAIQQLVRLFGEEAANPLWVGLQDWATETFTATANDLQPLSHHPSYFTPSLPQIWSQKVFLAGTETSSPYGGFLEGALDAAEQAVAMLTQSPTAKYLT